MRFLYSFRPSSWLFNMLSPRCYLIGSPETQVRSQALPATGTVIPYPSLAGGLTPAYLLGRGSVFRYLNSLRFTMLNSSFFIFFMSQNLESNLPRTQLIMSPKRKSSQLSKSFFLLHVESLSWEFCVRNIQISPLLYLYNHSPIQDFANPH